MSLNYGNSEQWFEYREDDVQKVIFVKETTLNDQWWNKVDYILKFIEFIYDMIRYCDTYESNFHLIHEKWNSMIEQIKLTNLKTRKMSWVKIHPFMMWCKTS